jgi:hypothetical protein
MSAFREPGFKERQEAAAKAKQAALDKLRARSRPGEPASTQQQAERLTTTVEPRGAKKARAAAQKAVSKPAEKEARAATAAEQKAARDKRDAPRKARRK